MKCDDLQNLLDDSLDRRLADSETAELHEHLASCAACSNEYEAQEALRRRMTELPRSINPKRDLWPEIDSRIVQAKVVRARFGRRAFMAAAAVVLLVSSVITAYLLGSQQSASTAVMTPQPKPVASDVLRASFAELGVYDYEVTRRELMDVLEGREGELSPATMEVVRTNLRLIDEAMDEIAEALGADPGNELLMRQLASVYRRQIDLLGRAAILPSEV